jgi:uncharacterized membrane protein
VKTTLLAISILTILFPVTIQAATLGNINGTILDENGNPLENVKVSAFLNTGSLEQVEYTNDEGYFRMNLGGAYILVFEKEGYVSFEKNVQITQAPTENPSNDIVKLGDLEMKKTLSLSASVVKRLTTPGNELTLEFIITNRGDETEDIMFNVSAPLNWNPKVIDNVGEIENILLNPGSAKYFLEINVPETATSVEVITITAIGASTTVLDFTITPKVYTDEIELKSTYLSISEELGQTIELPLTVQNIGEVDKKVTLSGDIPDGWAITFQTNTNMAITELLLSSGQSEALVIQLDTPDFITTGDYEIVVSASDVNGGVLDTLILDLNLREAKAEIEIINSFSEVSVEAGNSVSFPLVLWNQGESDTLTILTVTKVPINWDTSFISDGLEVASIRIPSGESESIELLVEPPKSVLSDSYEIIAAVESDDGTRQEIGFTIEVTGSYYLDLEMSTLYTTGTIGSKVTYTSKVTNKGQTTLTTLYLNAIIPDDWDISISPNQTPFLEPKDTVTFNIEVEMPGDTESGDYLVTMKAICDQLESDEIDVRITASASNTWGYIGLGIAAVAVTSAILLFRRFKRR